MIFVNYRVYNLYCRFWNLTYPVLNTVYLRIGFIAYSPNKDKILTLKVSKLSRKTTNHPKNALTSSINPSSPNSWITFNMFAIDYFDFTTSSCNALLLPYNCDLSISSCFSDFVLYSSYFFTFYSSILDYSPPSSFLFPLPDYSFYFSF